ncbi:MAG: hypothetical protein HYW28_00300 [Rhodospirillales bacterium]|nr:hypothetical protein [Candidatus Wildermuthbacteria bacterium]MBI2584309.1 hypothetical protein [Rhodospirillales bacterium]
MATDARQFEPAQLSRMLRKEIGHAADLLVKVQQDKAGPYAAAMAEAALKSGNDEDHVFWQKIAKEVEKRLTAGKYE